MGVGASEGQLGGARLSATRRRPSGWAPRECEPFAGPLEQDELLIASLSPHSCRMWPSAAAVMTTLR
jgi:hypothetical protein